jgi:glycosyltransferase involved in cell wall biosynthesis
MTLNRGGEKMIKSIATELSKRGHSVSVYSLPFRRKNTEVLHSFYYRECISKRLVCDVAYFIYVPLLHKLFRTSAPKIAGLHSFVVLPKFSHEWTRFPQFLHRHGVLASGATYFNSLTRNRDLNNFNAIHIPNILALNCTSNPSYIHQLEGLKKWSKEYPVVYTIPNWIDLQVFKPKMTKNDIFTVLFVGSEKWSKGYDIFYNIAKHLHRVIPKIKFIAVGVNEKRDSESFIEVHPFIYQEELLADIYSSSHVLIHPSRADIFGITLIESMACGTPVLTSALPSHRTFLPSWSICFTLQDYIHKTIEIYQAWRERPKKYELLVSEAKNLASRFDKDRIFPLFEKMLVEVADRGA